MIGRDPSGQAGRASPRAAKASRPSGDHPSRKSAPLLSELREPPVIGRYYMVPTVTYHWRGLTLAWPVLGPLHHDRELIGFQEPHYHFDGRFLTHRQMQHLRSAGGEHWEVEGYAINANVIHAPSEDNYWRKMRGKLPPQPTLRRRRCARPIQPWVVGDRSTKWGLAEHYGSPAEAIRRPDGRLLCPHRKADLSQLTPDADGIVTCPLHGLRVRCAAQGIETAKPPRREAGLARKGESPVAASDAPNPSSKDKSHG